MSRALMVRMAVALGLMLPGMLALQPEPAGAAGSCTVTTCTPNYPPPCGGSAPGVTNCGTSCTVNGTPRGTCIPDAPIACGSSGPGHDSNCNLACTAYGASTGTCTPLAPIACGSSGPGINACGQSCTAYGTNPGACIPDAVIACNSTGPGHRQNCPTMTCTASGPISGSCVPTQPIACGQTGPGINGCGQSCIASGPSCTNWQPYGYIKPGDADYGYPAVQSGGAPLYSPMESRDLVGLVAKGNIIVGDYTSSAWTSQVLPMIDGGGTSKTRPYAIDATDGDLGYHTGDGGVMYDAYGRPIFDGNYTAQDMAGGSPALKPDGNARHFYEATINDTDFQKLLAMPAGGSQTLTMDGVLFTNHAMAGWVDGRIHINGSMVSRDDGLIFTGSRFRILHDPRLTGDQSASQVALPFSIQRPELCGRVTCPASGCTSAPPACQ